MTFVTSRCTEFSCLSYLFSFCFPQTRLHPYDNPQGGKDGKNYEKKL